MFPPSGVIRASPSCLVCITGSHALRVNIFAKKKEREARRRGLTFGATSGAKSMLGGALETTCRCARSLRNDVADVACKIVVLEHRVPPFMWVARNSATSATGASWFCEATAGRWCGLDSWARAIECGTTRVRAAIPSSVAGAPRLSDGEGAVCQARVRALLAS